jgi:DNA-binding LacI/PurR family transcriptional regulator
MSDRPTLAEVAAEAGVSPATASRALNGSAHVTPATRRRVDAAVARLGYVRRRSVYARPGRQTQRVVAAAICEPLPYALVNPFHIRLLTTAEQVLADAGASLVVVPSPGPAAVRTLLTGAFGGVLLIGASDRHPVAISLAASGLPVRCAGRSPEGARLPYVDVDNNDGARQAARHLVRSGRRRVAVIAGPRALPAVRDRLDGFLDTLADAGMVDVPVAFGDFTYSSGMYAMRWLLDRASDVDAVFAVADTMAVGAVDMLRRAGRHVPDDVAAVGFDDAPFAKRMTPALTTVRQPIEDLTTRAVRLLLADMAERDAHAHDGNPTLPTELIVRESA